MRRFGGRAVGSAVLALLLACTAGYAAAQPMPVEDLPGLTVGAGLTLQVTTITPAVARPGDSVVVVGTLHNAGTAAARVGTVRLVRGIASMLSRDDVTGWAASTSPGTGSVIASAKVAGAVPAGGSVAYRLTVKRASALGPSSWGVLPVSIEAGPVVLHTFLGYQKIKEYEPLRTAWLVPLTLDADPALWGAPGPLREAAWGRALGPGSRLDRLVTGTDGAPVTWAVEPVLLTPTTAPVTATASPTASATPSPTGSGPALPEAVMAAGPEEARLRTEMADRLAALAAPHTPIVLPVGDADIAAAVAAPAYAGDVARLVRDAAPVAETVGGRADVAWPVFGTWNPATERGLAALYAGRLGAVVVNRSALTGLPARIASTSRTTAGTPLLIAEDTASAAAVAAVDPAATRGAAAVQQLVATTAVVLGDSPGLDRSLFIDLPREVNVNPQALTALFATVGTVPWLTPATVPDLLSEARSDPPDGSGGGRLGTAPTPLTPQRAGAYAELRSAAVLGAQIRADGAEVGPRWSDAVEQLLSARWRGAAEPWQSLDQSVSTEVNTTMNGVHVAPQTINFLADRGRVQLTVVNDLPVRVDNLTVTLTPDSPRLRIDTPPSRVRIGAHSRTTISVDASALAAGQVQVTARILGPTGQEVGREAVVQVHVTPTGSWIYWVLGGLAALAFLAGLARNLGRRRHAARGSAS